MSFFGAFLVTLAVWKPAQWFCIKIMIDRLFFTSLIELLRAEKQSFSDLMSNLGILGAAILPPPAVFHYKYQSDKYETIMHLTNLTRCHHVQTISLNACIVYLIHDVE